MLVLEEHFKLRYKNAMYSASATIFVMPLFFVLYYSDVPSHLVLPEATITWLERNIGAFESFSVSRFGRYYSQDQIHVFRSRAHIVFYAVIYMQVPMLAVYTLLCICFYRFNSQFCPEMLRIDDVALYDAQVQCHEKLPLLLILLILIFLYDVESSHLSARRPYGTKTMIGIPMIIPLISLMIYGIMSGFIVRRIQYFQSMHSQTH